MRDIILDAASAALLPFVNLALRGAKPGLWVHRETLKRLGNRMLTGNKEYAVRFTAKWLESFPQKMEHRFDFYFRHGHFPINSIILNPGNYCQLACDNCVSAGIRGAAEREMTEETMQTSIDNGRSLGTRSVYFMGGEPLHPKLKERVLGAVRENPDMFFVAFTNGIGLDERAARLAQSANLVYVLSCDGLGPVNDAIRGRGSFAAIDRASRLLEEEGVAYAVSCDVRQANYNHLASEGFVRYFDRRGATALFFIGYLPVSGEHRGIMLSPKQERSFSERLSALEQSSGAVLFNYANLTRMYSCRSGSKHIYIDTDGSVSPCFTLDIVAGNVREQSLERIITSPFFEEYLSFKERCAPGTCVAVCHPDGIASLAQKHGLPTTNGNLARLVQIAFELRQQRLSVEYTHP
jgi:radical SAM protein with 4Fe4S-binding SPASM domain